MNGVPAMLFSDRATVYDVGSTLKQHWVNISCLFGARSALITIWWLSIAVNVTLVEAECYDCHFIRHVLQHMKSHYRQHGLFQAGAPIYSSIKKDSFDEN